LEIVVLGLFDWKKTLLKPEDIDKVAKTFLGCTATISNNGWYSTNEKIEPFSLGSEYEIEMKVSHSRIIINVNYYEQLYNNLKTFKEIRNIREDVMNKIDCYLERKTEELMKKDSIKKKFKKGFPKPFIFRYPLIILDEKNGFYENAMKKDKEKTWQNVPWDISTTCFFTVLPDTNRKWWNFGKDRKISMRISGASLITRKISKNLEQNLINLLYQTGLYKMMKINHTCTGYVFTGGLEPLLEEQGKAMDTDLRDRVMGKRMERLNRNLLVLTIGLLVLTIPLTIFGVCKFMIGAECGFEELPNLFDH